MACPRGHLTRDQVGLGDRSGWVGEPQPGLSLHQGCGVETQRGGVPVTEPPRGRPCLGCRTLQCHCVTRAQLCGAPVCEPRAACQPRSPWSWSLCPWACLFLDFWNLLLARSSCRPPCATVRHVFLSCEEARLRCSHVHCGWASWASWPGWQDSPMLLSHWGVCLGVVVESGSWPRLTHAISPVLDFWGSEEYPVLLEI